MPEKYHIKTSHVLPRLPRIGKCGIVDWREDCARCHNCVKKACVYDKYREENTFIRDLDEVHTLYYECMGCFSCVQNCTKNLLTLALNSEYQKLGNEYWTPQILSTTWLEAETGKVPVSGAGYRGKFSGPGFDSMWTDMSEIVRPTRDGIHGREYISTSVDIN
jgi:ferredoxin